MANLTVDLRAYKDGLRLIVTPNLSMDEISAAIADELARMNQPLAGVSVQIDINPLILKKEVLNDLRVEIEARHDLQVRGVDLPKRALGGDGFSTTMRQESDYRARRSMEKSRIVRETIRSGQTETFAEGNLIIYGDVNPGGEVSAGGDIIVLGALRGSAHAGMNGRLSSVIIAMDLVPLQLQIGNYITRPMVGQKSQGYPEIARVGPQDVITVEEFVKV